MYQIFPPKLTAFRSDQISHSVVSNSLRPHESQHARPPCPSSTPGVHLVLASFGLVPPTGGPLETRGG